MIQVFTGNGCAYCGMVKKYLARKKVEFEEINVDEHPEYSRQNLVSMTGSALATVPVVVTPKGVMQGYNLGRLSELI